MDELASLLTRERQLLEVLLFRLETLRHFLAADEPQFVEWASTEVEQAGSLLRETEVLRAAEVARLAEERNLSIDDLSLRRLGELPDEPYAEAFANLRSAFLDLTGRIEPLVSSIRSLATRNRDDVARMLDFIVGRKTPPSTFYGPDTDRRRPAAVSRFEGAL
jgi:hypothetical protein